MQLTIESPSILICTKPVDFRKSIDGLLNVVVSELSIDPRANIFVFYNRSRDKVKVLSWHKNGFVLILKRLEKGQFFNAKNDDLSISRPLMTVKKSWMKKKRLPMSVARAIKRKAAILMFHAFRKNKSYMI